MTLKQIKVDSNGYLVFLEAFDWKDVTNSMFTNNVTVTSNKS